MGSVSRGRPRRGSWVDVPSINGMFSGWALLLGALLLSLAAVSSARPPYQAEEEEATLEPEGECPPPTTPQGWGEGRAGLVGGAG